MRLIKLFEQFVSEEFEAESGAESGDASMSKPKTVLNPQTLLDNTSTELNIAIGTVNQYLPSSLTWSNSIANRNGEIFGEETEQIVDLLDYPIDTDQRYGDAAKLAAWIKGNKGPDFFPDSTGSIGASDKGASNLPLKYRVTNEDGIIYPAVEDLRVQYNLDENFETLSSAVNRPGFEEVKRLLLECYQYWISSVDNSKFNPTEDDDLIPKGDMSGFAKS